jgi:hypothetical protein
MEWRLFEEGTVPHVSTAAFHLDRERAPHLEQLVHQERLDLALDFVRAAAHQYGEPTLSDLGAGDGGFLTTVTPYVARAWGYDFCPANLAGAVERGVDVRAADFTSEDVEFGTIVTATEVLEHLADPHGLLRRLWSRPAVREVVASSPWVETNQSHDACHAWAWDVDGYRALLEGAGWKVARHETTTYFQVILGRR